MHGPINVKSPNNTSKWQMGFNSAFKGLITSLRDFMRLVEATLEQTNKFTRTLPARMQTVLNPRHIVQK
jgi:hypothetical protein